MGSQYSRIFNSLVSSKNINILLTGPYQAGKSTILSQINLSEITEFKSQPSFGYDFQTMQYKNIKFIVCDTGGQSDMHQFLITQNLQIDAIIYVVDSADIDPEFVCEAKTDLKALMLDDRTINATLLMFANKQDRLKTMTVTFLTEKLELDSFNNQYHSQACSAKTGQKLVLNKVFFGFVMRLK
ncbi:ADP-ribosylation_factor [Hexamita inflata]|uniref:ADP-ribosylation factor n=1 Tax=Hexamita inflata TaxID=28002 RepID=A0AA86UEE8_9EUKA|nr:ADP-ribosylation factor [Hexamita inflata]